MIYTDKHFVTISYDETIPCVLIEWKKYASSEQFRLTHEQAVEAYLKNAPEHKQLHWLSDTRKFVMVSEDDIKWVVDEINPKLYEAKLKYMAFVIPESEFAKTSVGDYQRDINKDKIEIKNFSTVEEAKEWLKSCNIIVPVLEKVTETKTAQIQPQIKQLPQKNAEKHKKKKRK
ncbi:MAG: STAS/SEC14 domain-containing protein [Ignavibacteriaceae bacterium]|nr:STAS/SEC14 domain-containing protein [Ignavibacteriaceae bacterium]